MTKQLETEKSDEILSLGASLTLIEPKFGPRGPVPSPKVGLLLRFFLDFSLNPIGHTSWFYQPNFGTRGPTHRAKPGFESDPA